MIRKVYLDFIKRKISQKDMLWVFRRAIQYALIHISFLIGRPLCGPILGTLVTNYTCNYRCGMCNLPSRDLTLKKKNLKELTTSEMKAILKDFALLRTAGIGFTGGEPLLRKDIFELLKYTKDLGMITHLNTNGFFLDDGNIERLFDAEVDSLNISLDGATRETHDTIRGHAGAFNKVVTAVKKIDALRKEKKSSLRVKLVAVISDRNIDEVPEFIKLAFELRADCVEFIPQQPFSNTSASTNLGNDRIFMNKLNGLIRYFIDLKHKGAKIENSPRHLKMFEKSFKGDKMPFKCYAGYNSYAVDCYGEIYPCVPWFNWGVSTYNMGKSNIRDIWYSKEYNKVRNDILKCKGCYLNCQAELNLLFDLRHL